jgi:hypothetical protein
VRRPPTNVNYAVSAFAAKLVHVVGDDAWARLRSAATAGDSDETRSDEEGDG